MHRLVRELERWSANHVFAFGLTLVGLVASGFAGCEEGAAANQAEAPGPSAPAPSTPEPSIETSPGGDRAVGLTAGNDHACAWTAAGRVFCWGGNRYGAVGRSTAQCSGSPCAPGPVELPVTGVAEARASLDGTCARRERGDVVCWGMIAGGEPRAVDLPGDAPLEARRRGICALTDSGPVCLGGDLTPLRDVSRGVALPSTTSRPRGPGTHACAVVGNALRCWGSCNDGECGPEADGMVPEPVAVPGLEHVRSVALGNDFTCALAQDGDIHCFGDDRSGALGDGRPGESSGVVHVRLPLDAQPPAERVASRDETPPVLHVCDVATEGVPLMVLATRAVERGGGRVEAYLDGARGDPRTIARDARAADPERCATLIRILEAQ